MAERLIMDQRRLVERLRAAGSATRDAEHLLGTMEQTLEAYQGYCQNIVDAIIRIDARRT